MFPPSHDAFTTSLPGTIYRIRYDRWLYVNNGKLFNRGRRLVCSRMSTENPKPYVFDLDS
jgi:hypothetical protein